MWKLTQEERLFSILTIHTGDCFYVGMKDDLARILGTGDMDTKSSTGGSEGTGERHLEHVRWVVNEPSSSTEMVWRGISYLIYVLLYHNYIYLFMHLLLVVFK